MTSSRDFKWTVVGRDGCPYCDEALELLAEHGAVFEYFKINVPENASLRKFILTCGLTTVPQVYLNGQRLGGFDELKAYLAITRTKC